MGDRKGPDSGGATQQQYVAREISWFTTIFAVLLAFVSALPAAWAMEYGTEAVSTIAFAAFIGVTVFAMLQYSIYLVGYNPHVRKGVENVSALVRGDD